MTDNPLTLEWDEDGIELTLDFDLLCGCSQHEPEKVRGHITTLGALELYEHVEKVLGEWAREGIAARRAVKAGVSLDEFVGAPGALDDAMRDYGDTQRKREKEDRP